MPVYIYIYTFVYIYICVCIFRTVIYIYKGMPFGVCIYIYYMTSMHYYINRLATQKYQPVQHEKQGLYFFRTLVTE